MKKFGQTRVPFLKPNRIERKVINHIHNIQSPFDQAIIAFDETIIPFDEASLHIPKKFPFVVRGDRNFAFALHCHDEMPLALLPRPHHSKVQAM
jgi:hypothetical protein